jgi:nicotinamidase-related amidase
MDFQEGIVERFEETAVLDFVARAIDAFRAADIPVIYVRVDFRRGFPR